MHINNKSYNYELRLVTEPATLTIPNQKMASLSWLGIFYPTPLPRATVHVLQKLIDIVYKVHIADFRRKVHLIRA
jgi:hypothetical protein